MKWIPDGANKCCVIREDGKYAINRSPQNNLPGIPSWPATYWLVRLGSPSWPVCYRRAENEGERAATVKHLSELAHDQ